MNWLAVWALLSLGVAIGYFTCALMTIAKESDKRIPEGE